MINLYPLVRTFLFLLPPEHAHQWTLNVLKKSYEKGLLENRFNFPQQQIKLFGITMKNGIGLAAGFDRHIEYVDALSQLGFGFIEVGTITLKPQTGNPMPRLFRVPKEHALINRMGFPSKGLGHALQQLENKSFSCPIGINIGKNRETPIEHAIDEYVTLFNALAPHANYITMNISSPNTEHLRDLQHKDILRPLLRAMKSAQARLKIKKYVPLVIKISPDMSEEEVEDLAQIVVEEGIDGVIATNTTIQRPSFLQDNSYEKGGLSGAPLEDIANKTLILLRAKLGEIPIIASGGIMDEASALKKLELGAKALQIYTGLIYSGPSLIRRLSSLTPSQS